MTHEEDKFAGIVRSEARDYNEAPPLSRQDLDEMWEGIEVEAFGKKRFASPSAESGVIPVRRDSWFSARNLVPLAAVLVLGVAIGRFTRPRAVAVPDGLPLRVAQTADSVGLPEPYQSTTSRYLGQTAALLVSLPAEVRAGRADAQYLGRAHDLLLTTRLLIDSPASSDPRLRGLFEDLELVLAQVVRLQSDQSKSELDLIRQALEQRDVLPRLRTAVADISADD